MHMLFIPSAQPRKLLCLHIHATALAVALIAHWPRPLPSRTTLTLLQPRTLIQPRTLTSHPLPPQGDCASIQHTFYLDSHPSPSSEANPRASHVRNTILPPLPPFPPIPIPGTPKPQLAQRTYAPSYRPRRRNNDTAPRRKQPHLIGYHTQSAQPCRALILLNAVVWPRVWSEAWRDGRKGFEKGGRGGRLLVLDRGFEGREG